MIEKSGYYFDVPMSDYVGDPAPEPSLSTGSAFEMVQRSPLHAKVCHPRLGGGSDAPSPRGEIGSAVHAAVFGGAPIEYLGEVAKRSGKEAGVCFVPTDWKTKDAQDARDAIRERGALPMLECQRAGIERMTANVRAALEKFGPGKAEVTMLFQVKGAWCRSRADWLTDDGKYDFDLKTCDNADPHDWVRRTVHGGGLDLQAGLRSLGHRELGRQRKMVWLLAELTEPYAVSLVGVGPSMLELSERKATYAAMRWRACLDSCEWPGYRQDIHWADALPFAEQDFGSRQ